MAHADVRAVPYVVGQIGLILCISTLEHIGLDVSGYGGQAQQHASDDVAAMRELARVLAPDGRLLVTGPFGLAERHNWLKQYHQAAWNDLISKTGLEGTAA